MKKKLILILILSIPFYGFSQNAFEIETGLNVSFNSSGGTVSFANPALGPRIGINYLRRLTGWLDLETGLCYVQKIKKEKEEYSGTSMEGISAKYIVTDKYQFNYIELPLNLKFNIQNWFIYNGLYLSYPSSTFHIQKEVGRNAETDDLIGKEKNRTDLNTNWMDPEFTTSSENKSFDYGLNLGFGFNFNKFRLKAGIEYSLADEISISYGNKFKFVSGLLSLAYQFNSFDKIEIKKTDSLFNKKNGFLLSLEASDWNATSFASVIGFKEKKVVYFAGYERFVQIDYHNPAHLIKAGIQLYPHKNLGNLKFFYQAYLSNKWYDTVIYPRTTLFHLGSGFDYFIIKDLALGLQANIGYGKEDQSSSVNEAIFAYQLAFTVKYFLQR